MVRWEKERKRERKRKGEDMVGSFAEKETNDQESGIGITNASTKNRSLRPFVSRHV